MPLIETERCACGRPLHYSRPAYYQFIADQIRKLGPTVPIRLRSSGKGYWAPRHYLALHPVVQPWELEALAERYGWKPVVDRFNAKNGPRRPKTRPLDWDGYPRFNPRRLPP